MKKKTMLGRNAGIIIFLIYVIVEVFIIEITPIVAISILIVSIVLILTDGIKRNTKK